MPNDAERKHNAFRDPAANEVRTVTPSASVWHRSGDLLSDLARTEGLEPGRVSKSFANDVVLALSCREAGCVLVTESVRDFQRIRVPGPARGATQ